jgi:hypothetical protein
MEEDIMVRPGIPSVGLGSKGKAFPKGELLLLEREKGQLCFAWCSNEWIRKRKEYKSQKTNLPDRRWRSDHGLGWSDHARTEVGGQT